MKHLEFETLAAHAVDSVFAFADFTKRTEHLFDQYPDAQALQAYRGAWFEVEIVNATALDEWETDGRPGTWDIKWKERFLKDAEETVGLVRAAARQFVD
jgi:hypothetical protein